MTLQVREADASDQTLLSRLVDYYLYDFSEFDGRDLGGDGSYQYEWLDAYRSDPSRRAYLFTVDGRPAGFALVRLDPHQMAEFFVLRKYRHGGRGTAAARDVIARHPGRWVVTEHSTNTAATSFWRHAIPAAFEERTLDDGRLEQTFVSLGAESPRQ